MSRPAGSSERGVALLEANARLHDAHAALLAFHVLLRQADDLSEVTGAQLAALLCAPIGEVAAAKDEARAAARLTPRALAAA